MVKVGKVVMVVAAVTGMGFLLVEARRRGDLGLVGLQIVPGWERVSE